MDELQQVLEKLGAKEFMLRFFFGMRVARWAQKQVITSPKNPQGPSNGRV